MHPGDVEQIAAIEQASPSPWPVAMIADELERPNGLQFVAVSQEDHGIIGWCCGLHLGAEAELLKIAVAPAQRRSSVGTVLLRHLEDVCRNSGVEVLFLEVRAANLAAVGLYTKLGYIRIGCRKQYYDNPDDDALILRKSLLEEN
jgi:[ribosomal protein S18]-alanine N-acetyltransferase